MVGSTENGFVFYANMAYHTGNCGETIMVVASVLFLYSSAYFGTDVVLPFVNPDTMEYTTNAAIAPQAPERTLPLIPPDPSKPKLWYAPVSTFAAPNGVLLWYQRVDVDEKNFQDQRTLCLGVWKDGTWFLPSIGMDEPSWGGPNNVVMRRSPKKPTWGGFNVFQIVWVKDHFEMLYWDQPEKGDAGLLRSTSLNGKDWTTPPEHALFTEPNDAFTVLEKDGTYLLYQTMLEGWPEKPYEDNLPQKRRIISLRTSSDLTSWSAQEPLLRPDSEDPPETEFYLFKVFRYKDQYVGLLMKYYADPKLPKKHSERIQTEVLLSPDARSWNRPFRQTNFPFWTYADPFLWQQFLYFPAWDKNAGLVLYRFEQHRLFGVVPTEPEQDAVFTTKRFSLPTTDIALNIDAREGWAEVELLDGAGAPAVDSPPCRIAAIDAAAFRLTWDGRGSSDFQLWEARLRVRLNKARIFAIVTEPQPRHTP